MFIYQTDYQVFEVELSNSNQRGSNKVSIIGNVHYQCLGFCPDNKFAVVSCSAFLHLCEVAILIFWVQAVIP
ncbi:hypothetical protein DPMN_040576 [Dreissena polymorpha]|uniref:Uncharacterized protein n=1 Tax=Dreissena polymorpha TaxID=45954 RepID=A0A9D4CY19_DREPO|nr:hypothetical protein DPMN_040576 [Dreissena polymorpha]